MSPVDGAEVWLFSYGTLRQREAADAYEVADVKRVTARLGSGLAAFVYVG